MNPRIKIQTHDLQVDKPSGGGRGAEVLYIVEVLIDGEVALHLQAFHFKKPGQMHAFAEIMKSARWDE
jgi:hypothetical protein